MLFTMVFFAVTAFLFCLLESRFLLRLKRVERLPYLLAFTAPEPGLIGTPDAKAESEDDSDMKIAGGKREEKKEHSPDSEEEVEFTLLKNNGELARAHTLGGKICERIIRMDHAIDAETLAEKSSENAHLQLRLMLTFCAFYTVEKYISSRVLQSVIINEFYDMLKDRQPDYYNSLNETSSFSFYYLCVRGADKGECCIGQTYAMLVGSEEDQEIAPSAQALFDRFSTVVTDLIRSEGFTG